MRVIYQPNNNDALVRIINNPKRGVGEATLKKILDEAETTKRSLWDTLRQHFRGDRQLLVGMTKKAENNISGGLIRLINSLHYRHDPQAQSSRGGSSLGLVQLVEELIERLNLKEHIQNMYPEEHETRLANVDELVTLVGDFVRDQDANEELLPQLEGEEETTEDTNMLGRFLSNVALAVSAQSNDKGGDGDKPLVTISTIHAAKGLEWPVVFVPAVYNGSLPHRFSEDRDEERRLLYVAMTRAQALLYLSVPWMASQGILERSDFVPDEVVKEFAFTGPSFEQGMLETMAKILGRDAPSMKQTFASLPAMFAVEDDMKPDFPTGYPRPEGIPAGPSSRARRSGVARGHDLPAHERNLMPWQKDYSTTMEQASTFTTALPGFTTAGAHHSRLKAAGVPAAASKKSGAPTRRIPGSTNRAANQGSLSSFVRQDSKGRSDGPQVPQRTMHAAQVGNSFNQPLPPDLAREMAQRELQGVKRRVMKRRSEVEVIDLDADEPPAKQAKYPGFSSSPPRPASPRKENTVSVAAQVEAEDRRRGFRRPASLHATTMGRVSGAEVVDLTGDEPPSRLAPVERLRKPFKPLTINRNGNFTRQ